MTDVQNVPAPAENSGTQAPAAISEIAKLWIVTQETVIDESRSNPNVSELDKSTYERLSQANTDAEKQAILDESIKAKPEDVKLIWLKELLTAQKDKAYAEIDATIAEMNKSVTPEPTIVEEPKTEEAPIEEEFDLVDEDIIAEYEALKEYKAENEMQNRVKDKYIAQLEEKFWAQQEELLNFKASSVVLKDDVEQSIIQAKRAYDADKNDSTKYYFLYTMNKMLEAHGITIKNDIDALSNTKRNITTPSVVPNGLWDKSKTDPALSKLLIRR